VKTSIPNKIALVLGGGGLKGFAHVGVLRALEERSIRPAVIAGTSIGALVAAAHAGGMSTREMAERASSLRRRDLFRINHLGMLLERTRSPSFYLAEPLREMCGDVVPPGTFADLKGTLLVNTVDIERGTQLVWGLPGLCDVPVADAVYASCALPGAFPPGSVGGRSCVDGGTIENLPIAIAALGMKAVIAVDVGSSDMTHASDVSSRGFARIYLRAATLMMHTLQQRPLADWRGPPTLLIRPRVGHHGWFGFGHADEVIETGYKAACHALDQIGGALAGRGGVFPRRLVDIEVDVKKCIGCRTCVALAPTLMRMDAENKAYAVNSPVQWSPAEGDFVHHCPTAAITARMLDGSGVITTVPDMEPTSD